MKERILDLLVCPACMRSLKLENFSKENGEIKEGLVQCSCGQWFPIINFVPRLLLSEYRGNYKGFLKKYGLKHLKQKTLGKTNTDLPITQVQKSFGSKWMSQPSWGITGETKVFMREWILKKYGWEDEKNFSRSLSKRKRILDAGAGLGREMLNFCAVCKKGEVFGVDLSETVEAAYQNTKGYSNAHILQADVMRLPFKKRSFDFIFCEGVLHHTSDTKHAFQVLLDYLNSEGDLAVYIYKKKGPIREFCDDYMRQFSTKLSDQECWEFSKKITKFGKALSDLKIEFEIPDDIPVLEMKAGKYNLQRFLYYHIFKCFWNDRFTFEENNLINFDWYHPAYAWRHTSDELRDFCVKNDLAIIWWFEDESGITFRCQKG
jgi:arsenite methyltransferase